MYSFIGWEPNARVQQGSTWMNRLVLGDKAILQMKAEMEAYAYLVMILNQRVTSYGNIFYPVLGAKHWYTPLANEKMITVPISLLGTLKRDATYDVGPDDYNPDKALNISHDWGKFNSITIDQEYPREVRFIKCMHTFNGGPAPEDQDDLADHFIEYYRGHREKLIFQWGDRTGNNKVANSKKTSFEQFADKLRAKGWRVVQKKMGDVEHIERHRFISKLHKGDDPRLPMIRHNAVNCADLKISLEGARMKGDKKDKKSETNAAIKPQHATHYTDGYDNRLYHGLQHRERNSDQDHVLLYTTSLS